MAAPIRRPQFTGRGLSPAEVDRMLRREERVDAGLVRVECLRLTRPLLRMAGFLSPRPFERCLVAVVEVDGLLKLR